MVKTKKFEQSFVNEYLAQMLHDRDVKQIGIEEGVQQGQGSIVRNMISLGKSFSEIAMLTGLSESQIQYFAR